MTTIAVAKRLAGVVAASSHRRCHPDSARINAELRDIASVRGADEARLRAMRVRMRRVIESINSSSGRIGWWDELAPLPSATRQAILAAALADLADPHAAIALASDDELSRYGRRLGDIAELAEVLLIRYGRVAARRHGRRA